jgi:hypothetical protein
MKWVVYYLLLIFDQKWVNKTPTGTAALRDFQNKRDALGFICYTQIYERKPKRGSIIEFVFNKKLKKAAKLMVNAFHF